MKRTKLSAWLLTVVVFLISLGVIYWVGVPLGNPDANVLLAVEVVLAAAFAMVCERYRFIREPDRGSNGARRSLRFLHGGCGDACDRGPGRGVRGTPSSDGCGVACRDCRCGDRFPDAAHAVPHASLLGCADQEPPECLHDLEGGALPRLPGKR